MLRTGSRSALGLLAVLVVAPCLVAMVAPGVEAQGPPASVPPRGGAGSRGKYFQVRRPAARVEAPFVVEPESIDPRFVVTSTVAIDPRFVVAKSAEIDPQIIAAGWGEPRRE